MFIMENRMDVIINGKLDDISAMLVCAVRYSLGRRTYIVDWTCEFIENNLHLLTDKDKQVMINDIRYQERYGYGDECDKADWMKLLKTLEE